MPGCVWQRLPAELPQPRLELRQSLNSPEQPGHFLTERELRLAP